MKRIFIITLITILLPFSGTFASKKKDELSDIVRHYKVYWAGLHIGDLVARVNNDRMDTLIESYGIAKLISNYSSKTHATFSYKNGEYKPSSFFTEFKLQKRDRTIGIKYKNDGGIMEEAITPPDKVGKRPPISEEQKQNAVDPLTAFMLARQKIKENLDKENSGFSFNMYDGRRLSRLEFKIHGRKKETIKRKELNVVHVSFERIPIAGFTKRELKRMKEEEPIVTVYLSDDEYLFPIKADAKAPLGSAVMLLEKECSSLDVCIKL